MHKKFEWKTRAKLPATAHGYSMVKFACLDFGVFSKFFALEASPIEGQSLQWSDKKRENRKAQKIKKKT